MDEWRQGLAGMTGEQIKRGLETWDGEWPPSLPEFRNACTGHRDDWQHRGQAYKRFHLELPKPKADPAIARAELAKMRGQA